MNSKDKELSAEEITNLIMNAGHATTATAYRKELQKWGVEMIESYAAKCLLKTDKKITSLLKSLEDEIRYMKPHEKSDLNVKDGALISKDAVLKIIERYTPKQPKEYLSPQFINTEEKEPEVGDDYYCKVWMEDNSEPVKGMVEWVEHKNAVGGTYYDWDIDVLNRERITKIEWLYEPDVIIDELKSKKGTTSDDDTSAYQPEISERIDQLEVALAELHRSKDVSGAAYSTLKFGVEQLKEAMQNYDPEEVGRLRLSYKTMQEQNANMESALEIAIKELEMYGENALIRDIKAVWALGINGLEDWRKHEHAFDEDQIKNK